MEGGGVFDDDVLQVTAGLAREFLDGLKTRPNAAQADAADLRRALGRALQEESRPAEGVIRDLVRAVEPGLVGSAGGRFFGWVIGGGLPAALAADWLTSAWDQNAVLHACSPAASVIEDVTSEWLKDLLGLPATASCGFVTGCQMAHVTALAVARHALLAARDWDVDRRGLAGAPKLRVLTSQVRHESVLSAVCLLGFGTDAVEYVAHDEQGSLDVDALGLALGDRSEEPVIVCLQAGDINTGRFDPFAATCDTAHQAGGWVHVDGAFGLWAAASPRHKHLLTGVERADSWATDAHKWLNVPFDSGLVFVADSASHRAVFSMSAAYLTLAGVGERDQLDWTPEWSRRGRGFAVYAALRSLGRTGVADLVDRCCTFADQLVEGIGTLPDAEILVRPVINQGLVRFRSSDGAHDSRTDAVIRRVQECGEAWFTGTNWNGMRAMRVSVCNWRTPADDVLRAIAAVRHAQSVDEGWGDS